jgi:hypothetical protein
MGLCVRLRRSIRAAVTASRPDPTTHENPFRRRRRRETTVIHFLDEAVAIRVRIQVVFVPQGTPAAHATQ